MLFQQMLRVDVPTVDSYVGMVHAVVAWQGCLRFAMLNLPDHVRDSVPRALEDIWRRCMPLLTPVATEHVVHVPVG